MVPPSVVGAYTQKAHYSIKSSGLVVSSYVARKLLGKSQSKVLQVVHSGEGKRRTL